MSDSPPSDAPKPAQPEPPKRSRFRRYSRWLLKWSARAFVVLLVFALIGRAGCRYAGQRALRAEEARLDAHDPGWRAEELIAARNSAAPPEGKNSALVVRKVNDALPEGWNLIAREEKRRVGSPNALNRNQHASDLLGDDADGFEGMRATRELALTLCDLPTGHTPLPANASGISSFPQHDFARRVYNLLQVESLHAAQGGDPKRALRAARAALNAGRSLGEMPLLITAVIRYAGAHIAAESAIRSLALCDATGSESELAALQIALAREIEEPILLDGLRGERALTHHTLGEIENLTPEPNRHGQFLRSGLRDRVEWFAMRTFVPEDRRRYLVCMDELIDAAKGPSSEMVQRVTALEARLKAEFDIRYPTHRVMSPAALRVAQYDLRHRADCGSAAVLLACERFRLKSGRFPNALAELPKELLASVPTDPYTGAPLKFARTPDGIAVYAVPPKGALPSLREGEVRLTAPLGGDEFGWRLFDVKHRGLPPLPKPKPEPVPAPDLP